MGTGFNQLSGEDATALGFMAHGGHGCISVTSNVRRGYARNSSTPASTAITRLL